MAIRALLAAPVPSHPQDQGNSARINAFGRVLQSAGIIVHFLYYPMEGLTEPQRIAMEAAWDHFHTVPCAPAAGEPGANGLYRLDDWWNPAVAATALALHKRWHFRAVVANYVWFSALLEAFGTDVVKILDTHDVFGGRADRFRGAGLRPAWFYTSPEEEARGLARADIVLAIQEQEAEHFRALGHADVRVVGHMVPLRRPAARDVDAAGIIAGYLASGNPINVNSFDQLRRCLGAAGTPGLRFIVAGSICTKLPPHPEPFTSMGPIDAVDAFYDAVDLVINPMAFGTGLKIKSVEAVSRGMPLIATDVAMAGLPAQHPDHRLDSVERLAERLGGVGVGDLAPLAQASHACGAAYAAGVRAAYRDLVATILR